MSNEFDFIQLYRYFRIPPFIQRHKVTVIIRKEESYEVSKHRILASGGCNGYIHTAHIKKM